MTIPEGYCQCGCGQKTTIALKNDRAIDLIKGHPRRFISGHNRRGQHQGRRVGEKYIHTGGYIQIKMPSHPRAANRGYVYEHIAVMESELNRFLVPGEVVHHIDGVRTNNSPYNLMLFASSESHLSYHRRLKVFKSCGHYNWRKCWICGKYDPIDNLVKYGKTTVAHLVCRREHKKTHQYRTK